MEILQQHRKKLLIQIEISQFVSFQNKQNHHYRHHQTAAAAVTRSRKFLVLVLFMDRFLLDLI